MDRDKLFSELPHVIELHFWLKNGSHSMDAHTHNRCEYELLGILKSVAHVYGVHLEIETEPLSEGGIKRWFKVIAKSERKTAPITSAIIAAVIAAILVTPLSTSIGKITEKLLEEIFKNEQLEELNEEKLRLEIHNLRLDSAAKAKTLDEIVSIKKRRSNFYTAVNDYEKVEKVSLALNDSSKQQKSQEHIVARSEFAKYILTTDDLDPVILENVDIEIISPVLKNGNYKWRGIYNGNPIPFDMQSQEFKNLVLQKKVEFKNGSTINCTLAIGRKLNSDGEEEIVGYKISQVNHYFENEKPIETQEGRQQRQKRESDARQMKLFKGEEK